MRRSTLMWFLGLLAGFIAICLASRWIATAYVPTTVLHVLDEGERWGIAVRAALLIPLAAMAAALFANRVAVIAAAAFAAGSCANALEANLGGGVLDWIPEPSGVWLLSLGDVVMMAGLITLLVAGLAWMREPEVV